MYDRNRRYQEIFENIPVALFEEDCTAMFAALHALKARGIADLRAHFIEHPHEVFQIAASVQIIDINQHALELFEAASKEELLIAVDKIFGPDAFLVFRDLLVCHAEGVTYYECESESITLRGRYFDTLMRSQILDTNDGRMTAIISITDITARKRTEATLRAANQEIRRSNHELDQFAYAASHDLQEPLRAVASYADLLHHRYGENLDSDAGKPLMGIVAAAKRMHSVISGLLEYSLVSTRGRELTRIDCSKVLAEVLAKLTERMVERQVSLTTDALLPALMADPVLLVQLFHNLLAHGIKSAGSAPVHIHLSASRHGDTWKLSMVDTKLKPPPEIPEQAPASFFQLEAAHPKAGQNTSGISIELAIAQKIVGRHGGQIWLGCEPGQGLSISFTLKAADTLS